MRMSDNELRGLRCVTDDPCVDVFSEYLFGTVIVVVDNCPVFSSRFSLKK